MAKRGRDYAALLIELYDPGVLEVGDDGQVREESGAFVVCKKDSRQRANFEHPPHLSLASAEAFGSMMVEGRSPLYLGQGGVRCCCYQLELPLQCRGYFALPQIEARLFTLRELARLAVPRGTLQVRMWPRVVPMRWSWAVFLIQRVHEHVLREVVLPDA